MKKIFLSAALLFATFTTFAIETSLTDAKEVVAYQDEFKEISADEVPAAVKTTLEKSFPNAKLVKAYANEKSEYKLEISHGDKNYTVFSDAQGNIIKK